MPTAHGRPGWLASSWGGWEGLGTGARWRQHVCGWARLLNPGSAPQRELQSSELSAHRWLPAWAPHLPPLRRRRRRHAPALGGVVAQLDVLPAVLLAAVEHGVAAGAVQGRGEAAELALVRGHGGGICGAWPPPLALLHACRMAQQRRRGAMGTLSAA